MSAASGPQPPGRAAGTSLILIEDDQLLARSLVQRLRLEGVTAWWARTAAEGEALLRRQRPTMVVCDMRLPDGSGEGLIARLMPELGGVPVVAVTAYGGVEQAVRLMRLGVDDYMAKPFPVQRLLDKLAAFAQGRPQPVVATAAEPALESGPQGWESPPMQQLLGALTRLGAADATVLLHGESGAGKGVAARRLHALGPRAAAPFITVDCPALPASMEQAELLLFGRGEGSEATPGLVETAGAGTLFLDEVADLAPALQGRLLRLIEDRRFLRVGGRSLCPVRARIVAATLAEQPKGHSEGSLRADLWFRLAVVALEVPPLRRRPEDATMLAGHFLRRFASGAAPRQLASEALDALRAHAWPGNVRELRNRIERAVLLSTGATLGVADLFPESLPDPGGAGTPATAAAHGPIIRLAEARDAAEREHIRRVFLRCGGRTQEAARALGISRTTLWERMRRLEIDGR
jgi:DNA-binding NtrC family response regulator